MSLFEELKRRKVFKVGVGYLVVAWLVVQVASIGFPAFDAPPWALRIFILVLLLGFPISLLFAWAFDVTPEGVRADRAERGNKRFILVTVVLIALAFAWYFKGQPSYRDVAPAAKAAPAVAAAPAAHKFPARSIAVLPFVNMSTDAENEFFSDGISEEILNSLARIDGMQVVGRTSSFQFKGKNADLRTVGEVLGVGAVLEGSVRREGEHARITAQLIRTLDGIHLWSQTYDRDLKDSLAVQTDIAEQVAGALNVVLDDQQRARMHKAGVENVDAFIAYQKGLKLYDEAHAKPGVDILEGLRLANAQFDRATALEPDFYEAHFAKADLYEHTLQSDKSSPAERIAAQRAALATLQLAASASKDEQQRALTLAERQMLSDDWHGLAQLIESAFTRPGCNSSNWLPIFASAFGYGKEIEDFGRRASACDPLNAINYSTRYAAAIANGQADRALAVTAEAKKALGDSSSLARSQARALMLLGRADEAGRQLDATAPEDRADGYYLTRLNLAYVRGEDPAAIHAQLAPLHGKPSRYGQWLIANAVEAALGGNRAEANRLAAAMDARPAGGLLLAVMVIDCGCGAPFDLEATPRFKARLAESGLRWPPPAVFTPPRR
jgi:adenylate cyclase